MDSRGKVDETDRAMLVGRYFLAPLPWPISFNQVTRQALPIAAKTPSPLDHGAPTRVPHYGALPGHVLAMSPEEAVERKSEMRMLLHRKPLIPFLLRSFRSLSRAFFR
ncbi:hypothetical protein PBY51_022810 [Eleginops maclovinus]|uniref:Uncharacterized protein n=1 Tax=Eleginops maclovinus TaxID=56733 RepID=A0AAN7XG06_ELEMC|nr:hypothetical protein PBY51_022810 [Eleginops maclovinus]